MCFNIKNRILNDIIYPWQISTTSKIMYNLDQNVINTRSFLLSKMI